METLTLEELKQRRAHLASARKNAQLQKTLFVKRDSCKAKFQSSKTKPTQSKPIWKSIIDFLTK
jgi:hypothetical protein